MNAKLCKAIRKGMKDRGLDFRNTSYQEVDRGVKMIESYQPDDKGNLIKIVTPSPRSQTILGYCGRKFYKKQKTILSGLL